MENRWEPISFIQDGYDSFCVELVYNGLTFYLDVWIDNTYKDVECDWNQYIFNSLDSEDCRRQDIQLDTMNFDEASSLAICYLESNNRIYQDDNGNWFVRESDEV